MNRNAVIAVLFLLLLAAGIVAVQSAAKLGGTDRSTGDGSAEAATSPHQAGSMSKRDDHRRAAPADAAMRLRQLIAAGPRQAPEFVDVERMVSRLSDADLGMLRSESAFSPADTLGAWVRCAVFAELARRDPERAMNYLTSSASLFSYGEWALRQAWFSTFRGWAEVDPRAAATKLSEYLAPLNSTGAVMRVDNIQNRDDYIYFIERDERWQQQATLAVYAAFARQDPEAAWAAVPDQEDISGIRTGALEGLFRGVEGEANVRRLLESWAPSRLAQEQMSQAESIEVMGEIRIRNEHKGPTRESLSAQAALALERARPGSGQDWFFGGSFPDGADPQTIHEALYDGLARSDPDRAVASLAAGGDRNWTMLASLIRHHPDRAAEGFAAATKPVSPFVEVLTALRGQSSLRLEDLFPAPGRANQLPDWDRRYHDLLEIVEVGDFSTQQQDALRLQIRQEFLPVVPEARGQPQGDDADLQLDY